MMTKKQKEVLNFIEEFLAENGYSPSLREIAGGLRLSSVATIHQHVAALAEKGFLQRPGPNHKRGLALVKSGVGGRRGGGSVLLPLVGTIAAGRPIEALEVDDEIEIPENFLSGECYALRVRGESMVDDGIHDGDVVIVRSQKSAEPGQTVVAVVNGEATLKKFHPKGSKVELRPANETMAPLIVPAASLEIRGVLVSLLRRFR